MAGRTHTGRTHTCVFFDDGDDHLLCVCGARGMELVADDGETLVVLLLDDDATVTVMPTARTMALAATA